MITLPNMFPCVPHGYRCNIRFGYVECYRNLIPMYAVAAHFSYFFHHIGSDLRESISLAAKNFFRVCFGVVVYPTRRVWVNWASSSLPSFGDFIFYVVSVCSTEKMRWINTSWVIAAMKDLKISNDPAVVDCPRNPMCAGRVLANPHVSIPLAITKPNPIPTGIRLGDLVPEADSIAGRNNFQMNAIGTNNIGRHKSKSYFGFCLVARSLLTGESRRKSTSFNTKTKDEL